MNEKIREKNVLELWANDYPEVTTWLTKLQRKEQAALALYHFCEWAHKTPTELLALKKTNPQENLAEKLLDKFCGDTKFTNAVRYTMSIAVKSFFKGNYTDLAKASGVVNLEKVKAYHKLDKESLRKLWSFTLNPRDKALMTFVNSTAIAKETLTYLKWSHLEEGWETKDLPCLNIPAELLKGHGHGKYKGVRQITFLTPEAKRDLMNYREWLERPQKLNRKLTPDDSMWLNTYKPYTPLKYATFSVLIKTLTTNTGVPFSWHDARRWVNTALEQIGISMNWARKIRGRKVKGEEAPYSQPAINQLRDKFREAVPLLEFTTETTSVDKRLKELEDKYAATFTPEQVELRAEIAARGGTKFMKKRVTKTHEESKASECKDGEHCVHAQKVVSEEELAGLLSRGWTATIVLPSGKVVVTR